MILRHARSCARASKAPKAIEGYTAFRAAAEAVTAEDFPEAIVLDDGGVVALQFLEIVPAAPIPFDEAREAVAADWRAAQLAEALSARAIEIKSALEGGAAIGSFGHRRPDAGNHPRWAVSTARRQTLLTAAFDDGRRRGAGDRSRATSSPSCVLNAVLPADETGEDAEALKRALGRTDRSRPSRTMPWPPFPTR